MNLRYSGGFTLLELLIVILILGMLVSAVGSVSMGYVINAERKKNFCLQLSIVKNAILESEIKNEPLQEQKILQATNPYTQTSYYDSMVPCSSLEKEGSWCYNITEDNNVEIISTPSCRR